MKEKLNSVDRYFSLKPFKAGKISEISETTAASPVPAADRVNFHIGNPAQDERLILSYLRIILDLPEGLLPEKFDSAAIADAAGLTKKHEDLIAFFYQLLKNSVAYAPRGGFLAKNPIPLVKAFHTWLTESQDEPLTYDTGEKTGKRELIIASGGKEEALRILLHAVNLFSVHLPATFFFWNCKKPAGTKDVRGVKAISLPDSEEGMILALHAHYAEAAAGPVYLVLGKRPSESTRRDLRNIFLEHPLYFVEINDAPNHISMAREAGLKKNVLRILSMAALNKKLKDSSVVFLCGEQDILKVYEAVHFQLKGTPSASDIQLMEFLYNYPGMAIALDDRGNSALTPKVQPLLDNTSQVAQQQIDNAGKAVNRVSSLLDEKIKRIDVLSSHFSDILDRTQQRLERPADLFPNRTAFEIFEELVLNIQDEDWAEKLIKSTEFVFCKEHPEYDPAHVTLVSGSSRTTLGLLGFHCGIEQTISCDLSWNYEHCFPENILIPLTDDYELDVPAICAKIEELAAADGADRKRKAVVFNNPHNATGKCFPEQDIKAIITIALSAGLYVIDDLAYQNVVAKPELSGPRTAKQLSLELVREGKIYREQLSRVITVHSLSKTDCIAGSRLALVELADEELKDRFEEMVSAMKPNIAAVFLAYLFYRSDSSAIKGFWKLRNTVLFEKMESIEKALKELPVERNPFEIDIIAPQASMYPRMIINNLPNGLSLDWLSTELAAQGIGMVPLSSFARTRHGYELARKSFRLTLGGADSAETILRKTRKTLIDLNRIVADEKIKYIRHTFTDSANIRVSSDTVTASRGQWDSFVRGIETACRNYFAVLKVKEQRIDSIGKYRDKFFADYLPERMEMFRGVFEDNLQVSAESLALLMTDKKELENRLSYELYKDTLDRRTEAFRLRLYDRTVHPTQLYSLEPELLITPAIDAFLYGAAPDRGKLDRIGRSLIEEYFGRNIAINSEMESEEVLCDLRSVITAENYASLRTEVGKVPLLSYWGDWDGSTRPSGQGHRLVASVLIENIHLLAGILRTMIKIDKNAKPSSEVQQALQRLQQDINEFTELLNHITSLTNQLEQRFKSVLPFSLNINPIRRVGINLKLAKDPVVKLWQHNDRLEHKMIELREQRKQKLEYYFRLNKTLRKTLYDLIPLIREHSANRQLMLQVALYRDLLKRFVMTPRILQKLITAKDQFAINTTVHNIVEINEISGSYGNPGMILGLQVSMSSTPDALISLDRKLQIERQKSSKHGKSEIANVWCIPLFEESSAVAKIDSYLDKLWDYAHQSRALDQDVKDRFTEIFCETFIAGSDLSQQVGQTKSALLYKQAKFATIAWLSQKGLMDKVRVKLGSGEPMQRMGGYYAEFSGAPAFILGTDSDQRFTKHLEQSTIKSTEFAVSPLHGAFAGRDLRTLQSTISERLRQLRVSDRAQFLYHLRAMQDDHRTELIRAAEPFINTRFQYETRGMKELEKLAIGRIDETFFTFAEMASQNFREIVYGGEDDVVGIHIISYFLSRAMPILRDRPVERTVTGDNSSKGRRILERIAGTIPLRKHGSLLRAIAHNKAQTFVLGLNQLTTGLFRALLQFSQQEFYGDSGQMLIADKILTQLPVYEILHTLRLFEDHDRKYLSLFYECFPTGFHAFTMLREDRDAMDLYIPMLQKELLRRHGVHVEEFFHGEKIISELLPTLRPDLAVLLQPDLFNTEPSVLVAQAGGKVSDAWLREVTRLLAVSSRIGRWRARIWDLMEESVRNQTGSFVELAIALHTMAQGMEIKDLPFSAIVDKKSKSEKANLMSLFKGKDDDSMRLFLSAVVEYLSHMPSESIEAPIDIVRALRDVERILKIDANSLTPSKQELLNYYVTQISRLAGDNG